MISQGNFPEGESQLIDRVIAEYLGAESAGSAGDRQQWLDRYPECAAEFREFLDDRERVDRLAAPLQLQAPLGMGMLRANIELRASEENACQTVELPPPPPRLSNTRYVPLRFHARGGMGEIWVAKDQRIGRNVALKRLRSGRENQHLRFLVEAQVTGQLEHPSVVPLHDIGVDEAGQPFYVMKFIHGRRLREAIADFHAHKSPVDWTESLEFRRLLETLLSVCNVVAYAHHKGVVHRDIKPDNIMLGPYGEVVVVDWGLAKVIGQPDDQRGSVVQLSGSGSTATQDGAIVGSPFYMSPEGAKGKPDAVDQSSDVYLLGATLYEMLCARPPRQAASSWELIDLALHSRPESPRTVDPRIPRPLEAICLKAMAFDKQDRYPTPLALAEDVEKYLAGATTSAYQEPFWTRAGRWLRRHRRGITQSFAAALLLVLAYYAFQVHREAGLLFQREQARQQLSEFRRLADEAQFFAANTDAISERVPYYEPRRAMEAGAAALAIAAPWGDRAEGLPLDEERGEFLRSEYALVLLVAQQKLQSLAADDSPQQALALLDRARAMGPPSRGYFAIRSDCLASLGESQAAQRERERASAPATLITAQDHFLAGEQLRLRDAGLSGWAVTATSDDRAELRRDHLIAAIDEYRQALVLDPQHYWARFQTGRCLLALGRTPEAIGVLSGCVALRPALPWAYTTRGLANAIAGRSDDAMRDLDEAIRLDPEFRPAQLNRGVVHWLRHENELAIADFTAALGAGKDHRLDEAAFYRGQVLLDERREREAVADFSTVLSDRPDFQLAYWFRAQANYRLGDADAGLADVQKFVALNSLRQPNTAPALHHQALGKALRKLAQQLPETARPKPLSSASDELQAAIEAGPPTAEMWQQLGAVHELRRTPSDAIDSYTRGLALSPDDVQLRNLRGWAYVGSGQFDQAKADFANALRTAPNDPESHAGLGFVLAELGHEDAARREASTALLVAADNQLILHNVACIYGQLSAAQPERRIEYENVALTSLQRAMSISSRAFLGIDADERSLIRNESAFPASLKARPEFQRLISEVGTVP